MIAEPGHYFACSTHVLAMSVISKRCTTTDCDKVCIYMHVDTVTHPYHITCIHVHIITHMHIHTYTKGVLIIKSANISAASMLTISIINITYPGELNYNARKINCFLMCN